MCKHQGRYDGCLECAKDQEPASQPLNDLLNARERLEHENSELKRVLTEVCNAFMDVNGKGQFTNSMYADKVNKLLGI